MTQFIESVARLYCADKIDKQKIDNLLAHKRINQQEYDYIISAKKVV